MTDNKRAADDAVSVGHFNDLLNDAIGANTSSERIAARKALVDAYRAALSSRADVAADRTADRHYIAGMQVGYNFGVEENSAGMQKCIEQRQKDIRESKIDEPSRADGGKDSSDALTVWRAIAEEAEAVVQRGVKYLLLSEEMCIRLGGALETAPQAECAPRDYVETQPGSPNFDGAEAYEAHLNAECAPREAQCGNCNGTGRMVRDPDIGTDQECFACEGSGVFKDAAPTPERADAELTPDRICQIAYMHSSDDDEPLFSFGRRELLEFVAAVRELSK